MMRFIFVFSIVLCSNHAIKAIPNAKMTEILQNYQEALQKLLLAHDQDPLHTNQNVFDDVLIFTTYKKLIAPSTIWINGYARIISSEMVRKFPYRQDLHRLALEYKKHRVSVQKIINLFPKNAQAQALEIFHDSLTAMVGQVCFDIVQQLTNRNEVDESSLTSAYQAYNLAWDIKTSSMKLHGAATLQDFQMVITQNMTALFSNAVNLAQNLLSSSMSSGVSVEQVYKNLEQYYQVLNHVYQNSGDTTQATQQQNLLAALHVAQQNYAQAKKQQVQATALAQKARTSIILDLHNAATLLTSINSNIEMLTSAVQSYAAAQQSFQNANDNIGVSVCTMLASEINDGDLLLRVIQKLWALFLNDQSQTSGFYTFPTLDQFVNGQASGQTTNAVQVLQNLSAMCSAQSADQNNVGSLISMTNNLQIMPILQNILLFLEQNPNLTQKVDTLFDLSLLQDTQTALSVLVSWCNQLLASVNNSDQEAMAQAMGYAQLLDNVWIKNNALDQYLAHLPDCLSSDATWVNFTAQFLYQASLLSSPADAQDLLSSAKVQAPVVLTVQDLKTMQAKADTYFAQAEAFEKSENFVQATIAYEKAMMLYQKLYQHESTGMEQIKILTLANQAKTRFAACSFGSTVQSQGAQSLGAVTNIPATYTALNYQLSFDPTLMGSLLPKCLSSLTAGQTLSKLSVADQKDIFALIKGYLVAQKMVDQGIIFNEGSPNFTDYFTDYTLTKVVQASQRASLIVNQISSYLNNFENIGITSVTLNSSNQVNVALTNWPLDPLVALCSTLSSAATYFGASADLFAPGTVPLTFGAATYDPGNDIASQNLMLQNLGYAYLCAAQHSSVQLAKLKKQISTSLGMTAQGATAVNLPQNFSAQFNAVANQVISLQALLYGSANAASGYFAQAGNVVMAKKIKDEFLNLYQQQIEFSKKCLIGDPTNFDYQTVVTVINQAYVSWASELDPVKDVGQIANINEQIAKLYEFAGQKCLSFSYTIPSFPDVSQKHFMVAAQYYRSAQLQYKILKDTIQEKLLAAKLNDMYFQACVQNLNLYLYVKQHGALYDSISQNAQIPVSFVQLLQDFANGSIGSGESDLYKTVQNLLFDAAMVLEFLSSGSSNHQPILAFLAKKGLIDASTVTSFSAIPLSATEKIVKTVVQNYTKFTADPAQFAAINELMFSMVKNMYMMDYQSIVATSTQNQISLATQQFLSSISNEASSLQNPSAGYVG